MRSVQEAYDRHAAVYDDFLGRSEIRLDVWKIADRFFRPGTRLLDLGCGTGEDALHFSERDLQVTAVDISPAMIARLKSKCGEAVRGEVADMQSYSFQGACFDGVFANFSALNYVPDLGWLRQIPLMPDAHLVLTTLGRFYPLETAIFLLKGKPRLALRRFKRSCDGEIEGIRFKVYYHSLQRIRKALGERFELKQVTGLRALRPIPNLSHLEQYETIRTLRPLDRWWCSRRSTAVLCDQFVSVWQFSPQIKS